MYALLSNEKIHEDIKIVLSNFLPNLILHIDKINIHIFFDFLLELSFKVDLSMYAVQIMVFLCKKIESVNGYFLFKNIKKDLNNNNYPCNTFN